MEPSSESSTGSRPSLRGRLLVLALIALGVLLVALAARDSVRLEDLARRESELRQWYALYPARFYLGALVLYVFVTALSLPLATTLTLVYAWLFGFTPTVVLVSFAATAGASLAFLLSRYLLGDLVRSRLGDRLRGMDEAIQRDGAFYLLALRLQPLVPFFVINLVMGLTQVRLWTFWWASQLGMFPATCVFASVGAALPSLERLAAEGPASLVDGRIFMALALLGLFPLAVRKAAGTLRMPWR